MKPTTRAAVITRRTYCRPLDEEGTTFETWDQVVDRVIHHQHWLWVRAKGSSLDLVETAELEELRDLYLARKALPSGRTLWLGGTEIAKRREASQFNCSFLKIETVHDVVDAFWLLLQGCGVGFEPVVGTLSGFAKPVEIEVVRSERADKGDPRNHARIFDDVGPARTFWLTIGDSAEAWAKSVGKLLALKTPVDRIVLDFSEVRPAGTRLKGYGWISSGDETFSKALTRIAKLLSERADQLLTRIDILDVLNHLGTTLSSRRSAEICVVPENDPEAGAFMLAKDRWWEKDAAHRQQSNNSIVFWEKPSRARLRELFDLMIAAGGSEPGFINGQAAKRRAPWFKGVNPCAEILLGNKSFCNLVEIDLTKFVDAPRVVLLRALYLAARANYRQTCVDLDDGVLQRSWHELNEFLRLCGVGLTGIVRWLDADEPATRREDLRDMRAWTRAGAEDMAAELGLPMPKAVTTVKPSGTLSKIMSREDQEVPEGVHRPLGRFVLNNVTFSKHDPLVEPLRRAGYRVEPKPFEPDSVLVTFPVDYSGVAFDVVDGKEVNVESAVDQLERYRLMMSEWVDHNCSITVSYDPSEVEEIVDWLCVNWDDYVGVSWIFRNDPTKTAVDLGYAYLPQEVVTEEVYRTYVAKLSALDVEGFDQGEIVDDACASGACPVR